MKALREKVFRGWPAQAEVGPLDVDRVSTAQADGIRLAVYDFNSQPDVRLRLFCVEGVPPSKRGQDARDTTQVTLNVLDEAGWSQWLSALRGKFQGQLGGYASPGAECGDFRQLQEVLKAEGGMHAYLCPRGVGPAAWSGDERKQIQIRRRFMLLGQTLDGMRVWDVRRAIQALGQIEEVAGVAPTVAAGGNMAGVALYAAVFEPKIAGLDLTDLPTTQREGPILLNVLRYLDMPQAVALAAEHTRITLHGQHLDAWQFPACVAEQGWINRISAKQ
jgi:hypothetical protein